MGFSFTESQIRRYSRQIVLPGVGGRGQEKLLKSGVLVVGAGGLGSPAIQYLAAAGVGRLGIVDDDRVDISNLQRQTIHLGNVDRPKAESAREFVGRLNPDVRVEVVGERLGAGNARGLVRGYDFVLDGSDNFATRYLVNDACVLEGRPFCSGAIFRFEGQVMTVLPGKGPCYRCVFPEAPPPGSVPNCQEGGVFGFLPGVVGNLQAGEAVKYLLGRGDLLVGRLLLLDLLGMRFDEVRVRRSPRCAACGDSPVLRELREENYRNRCELPRAPGPKGGR